jgi:uroporphyrinogen decarboxylase
MGHATMAKMTSAQRVMTVLRRGQPDRIPHFEWIIDRKVRHALCPGASTEEFTVRMGLDAMLTAPDFRTEQIGPNRFRNEWGIVVEKGQEQHSAVVEAVIRSMEDFQGYQPPAAFAPYRFESLKKLVARYKGVYAIGVHLNDVLSIPRNLMGFEELLMAFRLDPELVARLVEMSVEVNIQLAGEAARYGADFVFTGDDYSSGKAPFMAPAVFRELLYPGLKRVVQGFHGHGLPVIKHTDGNIMPLMDMIVDAGFDCLDPIDPLGSMDMARMKREYGQVLALKGNVNCATTLVNGTACDVVQETLGAIQAAAEGGGLIVSSSNSIHSSVAPLNYLAMLSTIKAYGRYPIRSDFDPSGAVEAFS